MKIPTGIVPAGKPPVKGHVYLSSCGTAEGDIVEYGLERDGSTFTCSTLTAPGDVLQLEFVLTSGSADFIDVMVDGVRRFSAPCDPTKSEFRGVVKRVLSMSRGKGAKRGGLKNSLMQVKSREMDTDFDQEGVSSPVGTIIFQIFRKHPETDADDTSVAERYPDFEKCASWDEASDHNGFQNGEPTTSMEFDLIDGTKGTKALREKIQKSYTSDYKVLTTIIFKLRTTEELEAMGKFGEIPVYVAPKHTTAEQKRANKAATPKTKKEDDASSIAGDDEVEPEEDERTSTSSVAESSKKPKSTSVASSAKKSASKAAVKGKSTKVDTPSKSTGKKTKTTKEANEEHDDDNEKEQPEPKVDSKSASKPRKTKTPSKRTSTPTNLTATKTPAKTPAETSVKVPPKAISINSDAGSDSEDEEETEDVAMKDEKQTSTQPPSLAASNQNEISIADMKAIMEHEKVVEVHDEGIVFSNPFVPSDMLDIHIADNMENTEPMQIATNVELAGNTEKDVIPLQVLGNMETAISNVLEEIAMEPVVADQNNVVQDTTTVSDTIITPQKKPLSLKGSPAAPAHHAWVKRDLELAAGLTPELLESRYGPASPTAVEEGEVTSPSCEHITPAVALPTSDLQPTSLNPGKSNEMPQSWEEVFMREEAQYGLDSSYDYDDLDAAVPNTPSRRYGGRGRDRVADPADVSPFTTGIGRSESVILGASYENNIAGGGVSQQAMRQVDSVLEISNSQATDIAPLKEILASVANSKRDGADDNGMQLNLAVDADDKPIHVAEKADGAQVSASSAFAVIIEAHATNVLNTDMGEVISQSLISTQSQDSQHEVVSSPVPETAKVKATSGQTSGQKNSSKDDSDDMPPPKSKPASTPATAPKAKAKAKRKSDITDDAADEEPAEPEPKKKTPAKSADKKKRVSISDPPKQAANTTIKKSAEKRKSPAKPASKTADKRKSAGISDTKDDDDSPRKSAGAPAGRNTVELDMVTAKAKLEAAEKRKLELEEEYKAALLVKDEWDKAQHLTQQAEEIERENAELQAKIAAIYGGSTN